MSINHMRNLLFLFVLFVTALLPGQTPNFETTMGGSSQDIGRSAIQTADKQYVSVGASSSFGAGSSDVWLVKSGSKGWPRWTKTFGGTGVDWGYAVKEIPSDSGLVIAGYTDSYGNGGYDCLLIRTDSLGNTKWMKTYGGTNWDFAFSMSLTSDGGFILAGGTYSSGAGDEDVYVVKTNANGDTLWTRTYGGKKQDEARSIKQTADGGYILSGTTKSFGDSINGDAYVIRLKPNGDTLWTRHVGGAFADDAHDIIQCLDSSFYLVGSTSSWSSGADIDVFMARFSPSGNVLWTNHIGNTQTDKGEGILQVNPGLFALVGSTKSFGFQNGTFDVLTIFVDGGGGYSAGGHTYGDTTKASDEEGYSMVRTKDKGFLFCGYSNGFNTNGVPDFFLVKTDSLPASVPCVAGIQNIQSVQQQLDVYPNPLGDQVTVRLNGMSTLAELKITVLDVSGRIVPCQIQELFRNGGGQEYILHFNRDLVRAGMYFLEVTDQLQMQTSKLILH
jgi:hypothetical protein